MVCGGRLLYYLLISLAVALITYNAIISSTATLLAPGFPGRRGGPFSRSSSSDRVENRRQLFHTAVTASDSAYNAWQCRVMYYWFKKAREARPDTEMGGFTRILHSGRADNLVDEIPTFVADPLPNGMDQGYIVLNRPWAFVQWLQKATIQEEYIFMAEPDHIIVKPIPNLAKFGSAAAFPFFYIEPKKYEPVLRNFYPEDKGPITNIDPIGNSPVIVDKASLRKIAPTWMNISLEMKKNPEADKAFGWVLEMYAYAVASALHGVGNSLHKDLMIQPPWDLEVGDKYIIHYTYGCDYNMKGELTYGKIGEWRFDKRLYTNKSPPKNLPLPPAGVARSVKYLDLFQMVENPNQSILHEFLKNELMEDAEDIDEQRMLRLYEQQQMVCQRAQSSSRTQRRMYLNRNCEVGHARFFNDYFSYEPKYPDDIFQCRMQRGLCLCIVDALKNHSEYFQWKVDATGKQSLSPLQKCTMAIRQLTYGVLVDHYDEYL